MGGPTKRRRDMLPFGGKKLASSSGAGSAATGSTSSTALMEASPTSRTDLYRLSYHLENLIDLWVVEVETASDVSQTPPDSIEERAHWAPSSTKEWALVENRKIRYKCITELLKGDLFEKSGLREHIVVNMGVSRHTDHLVIPIYGTDLPVSHQVPLKPGPRDLTEKKEKHIPMHGNTGKMKVDQNLRCTLMHGRRCNPDRLGDLYWKSLFAVIKKRATPIAGPVSDKKKPWTPVSLPHFTSLKFDVNKEFYREMTDIWGWEATSINPNLIGFSPKKGEEVNIEDRVELLMRRQPTLDKERRLLHIKIGLVAQFPRNKLSNMLRGVFKGSSSSNIEVWNVAQVLPAFLRGLRVRRCYKPPTEAQMKKRKRGTDLWQYRQYGALEQGTVFQIVDIKWPHELKKQIAVDGFEEPLSVPEYFEHVILPEGYKRDENIKDLPLVSDHKGHWHPLDVVVVDDPHVQGRKKFDHITRELKGKGAELLREPFTELRKYGDEFFNMVAKAPATVGRDIEDCQIFSASLNASYVNLLSISEVQLRLL